MVDRFHSAVPCKSFHVYEFNNEFVLFDRVSGLVCEINEFAFDLFRLIEEKNRKEPFQTNWLQNTKIAMLILALK